MNGWRLALMLVLFAPGCAERSGGEHGALEEALANTRQTGAGAGTASLLPFDGAEPHQLRMDAMFALVGGEGEPGRGIRVTRDIFRGKGQAFRIEDTRLWTDPVVTPTGRLDGRETVYDGERLAVRRQWGPWMERETLGRQHQRLLAEAYDVGPAVLGAFGPYLIFTPDPEGEVTMAGVRVKWEQVALDPSVAPRPLDDETLRTLREHTETWKAWMAATHKPHLVEGRLARRVDGQREIVAGRLVIKGVGKWQERRRDFQLEVSYQMSPLPPQVSFTLPEDRLPARRSRPWRMVKSALGEDLLAPYRD